MDQLIETVPECVELAVLRDDPILLGLGVDHAEDPRLLPKRIPSATIKIFTIGEPEPQGAGIDDAKSPGILPERVPFSTVILLVQSLMLRNHRAGAVRLRS
jgi:hypothetical protein